MNQLPEAFLIYKAEVKRLELEKEKLRKIYEEKITAMKTELSYLKEQINSQQEMLKISFEYALRIEKEMNALKKQITTEPTVVKKGRH